MARRDQITAAILEMLKEETGRPFSTSKVPLETPKTPYGILYDLGGVRFTGSMASPEEDNEWLYQITNVGQDDRQAEWMSWRTRDAMVGRLSSGALKSELDVIARITESLGPVEPTGQGQLYQVVDRYRILTGA